MRDYAKRRPPAQNNKGLLFLALLIFFLALVAYIYPHIKLMRAHAETHSIHTTDLIKPKPAVIPTVSPKTKAVKAKPIIQAKKTGDDMQYDFYKLLPAMTVTVPSADDQAKSQGLPTPAAASAFILQVAAVQNQNDAKTLQTQLSQAGYKVFIQPYLVNNATWYRVNVGPFASLSNAQAQQLKLDGQNVEAMLLKVK